MASETVGELRRRYRQKAFAHGVSPRDVDVVLADLLEQTVAFVAAHDEALVDGERFAALMERRLAGEPLQYIRGRAEFYSREFLVDPRVLIPRPETELLVEAAIDRAPGRGRVVDVGTGSGCIAISMERARPDLRVAAVDRSIGALAVARANAARHDAKIHFAASDLLSAIDGEFDLIVSNPPYIPAADMQGLQKEVRLHEPHRALTPGRAGTEIIARLFDESRRSLARAGKILIEIGYGQSENVRDIAAPLGFRIDEVLPDLAGIPRVVISSREE